MSAGLSEAAVAASYAVVATVGGFGVGFAVALALRAVERLAIEVTRR